MFTLENILSPHIVQKLGWTLLHFVWQGAVVALLLAIVLRILRKSTASIRYIVACSALAVIVLTPMITFKLVPGPDPAPAAESMPIIARLSAAPQELYTTDMPLGRAAEYMQISAPASWKQRAVELFEPALPYVVLGWLIGVVVLAVWHLGGWAQLQRLKHRIINEVEGSLTGRVNELAESLGVKRAVRLLESAFVQVPTVVGWLRPVILLPVSALTGLTAQQLEALLAHELAHIKRLDYLLNMLQTIVEILGFYHPAVWWVSNRIRLERENCCDDLAVSICGDTRQYVKALAQMERIRCGEVELAIAASGGNLYRRISRLLGKEVVRRSRPSWVPAAVTAILLIALAIPAALAISGGNSNETLSATVSNPTPDTTTDQMLPPAPVLLEITGKPQQIAIECKFIEVPADSEFVKDKNPGDIIMWLDGEFTSRLEALIRATQGANVLTAPKLIVLDEDEAMMATGEQWPCITGYEEGADANGNPKPIINYVFCGLELKIKPNVVDSDAVHMDIHLSRRSKPAEQKDASGRTIHVTTSSDSTTEITVNDGDTIIICGPKDVDRPDRNLVLQITPHITRPDEHIGIQPRAGTRDRSAAAKPTKAAEYPVTMAIKAADYAKAATARAGQNPLGAAIRLVLDSIDQLTAAGTQIDDLAEVRKILSAQGFTIDAANFSGDKCSLVISKPIEGGTRGRLVCRLTKQDDSLLIDRIDFEPSERIEKPPTPVPPPARQPNRIVPTLPVPDVESATLPVRARRPIASTEDKTQVQIDCLMVEVFTDGRMDSETASMAENLIGDKTGLRSRQIATLAADALLRKVADATAAFEDAPGQGKRVTQDQFKALVTMLASKGYMKILMNPTLQVVDGQTARIHSTQGSLEDSLEITPCVLEDGRISLAVQAMLATKPTPDEKEQTSIVTEHEISALDVRAKPGQSLIISGIKKTEKRSDARGDVRVTDERPTEVLFILTPTIVGPGQQADEAKQAHDNLLRELGYAVAGPQADELRPPNEALLRARKYMHPEDAEQAKTQSDKETTIFPLKYGNANELAGLLNQIVGARKTTSLDKAFVAAPGLGDEIRIVSAAVSNQLIVQASREDLRKIEGLIARLDVPTEETTPKTIVQIFKLKYADCEQASTILTPLVSSERKITIVTDARSNQLIVQATAADMQQIERLIAEIDVPAVETAPQGIQLNIRAVPTDASSRDRRVAGTEQLQGLEQERKALAEKLQSHRQAIRQMAQEYGMADLTKYQDLKLQRVATLLDTLTKTEARRMQLETELNLLGQHVEQAATPQELLRMRQDYVNSDPTIKALAEKTAQVEMELLLARQTSSESSPEVTNKTKLLQDLQKRLDALKMEARKTFDDSMAEVAVRTHEQKRIKLRTELEQLKEYEKRLDSLLNQQDAETKDLGRKQLELQELQRQIDLDQQMYDTVCRRLKELQLQQMQTTEPAKPELVPEATLQPALPAPSSSAPPKREPTPSAPPVLVPPAATSLEPAETEPVPVTPPPEAQEK